MTSIPNEHERKVDHVVYDVFYTLLDKRDPRAAQMAAELAAVAKKYEVTKEKAK